VTNGGTAKRRWRTARASGIRFYWLVDPEARTFEIFELAADAYEPRLRAQGGTVPEVPGCPRLELDLDAMWGKVDALEGP
jgi:Uma2 family endonuclease